MTPPRILPLIAASLVLAAMPGRGAAPQAEDAKTFLAVALHDIVDDRAELDADSTTTSDLVTFFEYLVSNGWHALTLDEIDRAGRGEATLPEKSILITIDDGYASDYTRIYPLLLATRMSAVMSAIETPARVPVVPGSPVTLIIPLSACRMRSSAARSR